MKKIISILLVVVLTMCMAAPIYSDEKILSREEIPSLLEDSAMVQGLNKLGILKGTGEGFELLRPVTRAEAVCLIFRIHPDNPGVLGMPSPVFTDMDNHWAYKEVTSAKKIGLVDGTTEDTFTPDRTVTGREFTKILLSMLGYSGITIENAYEKGIEAEIITNNFTKSIVYSNEPILRSDAVRLCFGALTAKTADENMLYKKLIDRKKFTYDDFYGVLFAGDAAADSMSFTDSLNELMPEDKNYMFSPLSIKMAFAMAANGADGETKSQILSALEIDDLDAYNEKAKELINQYLKTDILKLNIANAVWLNESNTADNLEKDFESTIKEYYQGDVESSEKEVIAGEINSWVNEKTNGKIDRIISDEFAQRDDFILALLNAVYFKGAWQNEFSESATDKDIFKDRNGNENEIDFMNKTAYFRYFKDENKEVLAIPYKNVTFDEDTNERISTDLDVAMYLIKGEFKEEELSNLIKSEEFKSERIALSVPKFESEFETSLSTMMKAIGVENAFNPELANFSKLMDEEKLYIMDAIHKTYIKVDEKGTEAAAVTGLFAGATSAMPKEPIKVKFDTPFTYVIRDNTNGEVLFVGEYAFCE